MLVISGNINSSRPGIDEMIEKRDQAMLIQMVRSSLSQGAEVISVNCGTRLGTEVDDIEWMVRSIMQEFEVPMCIDSPNVEAQKAGLSHIRTPRPIMDSITADPIRMKEFLPLAQRYQARVVALTMDEKGIPGSARDKLVMVQQMKEPLKAYGIPPEDVYLDPLLFPLGTDWNQGKEALEAIALFKREVPEYKVSIGLDNISHGLPKRELLSGTFLAMAVAVGLDGAFIVLDEHANSLLVALDALMGEDPYCKRYIQSYRQGLLDI